MKRLINVFMTVVIAMLTMSCSASFDKLMEEGKYKEAEELIKAMKGAAKYDCAEILINEYIELEEYDRAVYVYENCTPEHCSNDNMRFPNLYCHGSGQRYELNVTTVLRKVFMETGDYDKVWQYSIWNSDGNSGYDADAYYRFMSDVILYLCSTGDKLEANRFLNRYVYWFDANIDNSSHYSTEKPQFMCEVVREKFQRIINTY